MTEAVIVFTIAAPMIIIWIAGYQYALHKRNEELIVRRVSQKKKA